LAWRCTTSPFNFEIEPENIILVALRLFEFPHGLDQLPTFPVPSTIVDTALPGAQEDHPANAFAACASIFCGDG
jgi:hypothetical protein